MNPVVIHEHKLLEENVLAVYKSFLLKNELHSCNLHQKQYIHFNECIFFKITGWLGALLARFFKENLGLSGCFCIARILRFTFIIASSAEACTLAMKGVFCTHSP